MALFPDYASLADMRAYLRIDDDDYDTTDDVQLGLAITAASRAIDRSAGRQFGLAASAVARVYTAEWNTIHSRFSVDIDDLMTTASLVIKEATGAEGTFDTTHTDYRLLPFNAAGDGRPWTRILFPRGTPVCARPGSVEITARWGWTTVPDTIKTACLVQASRFHKRRDSPFGIAGSPELGNELRLLDRLDPDVAVMVAPYRRWWGAAR